MRDHGGLGWVDPDGFRGSGDGRTTVWETFGMGGVGTGQRLSATRQNGRSASVMHVRRCEPGQGAVMVLVVVPGEEVGAVRAAVLETPESGRKIGTILEGLELCLAEGVVVRDVRPRVRALDV